jgi:uncharacterized domain HDIG
VIVLKRRITKEECEKLYKEYDTPPHVIRHCQAVSSTALRIAEELNKKGYDLDTDLIKGAGLAHDVARLADDHAAEGAKILRGLGFDDEADIVGVHMTYDFNPFEELNETDMVCLADRLVKEDEYVGLDERIEYLIHKRNRPEGFEDKIMDKKAETRAFMDKIEAVIGKSIDSLFKKG